ncbi:uncharacterized protein LOC143018906 [Oratosquilla oratoria]|uniref:uncharacterized protein LOC143018906 n=1 Tax=Oratosquilla oratoria TaxID=337810 RepID=UPI003F75D9B8
MEEMLGFLENEKLSPGELMALVSLCLDSTFFKFRDSVYHQRVGTPMASPASVILAEITMKCFEEEVLVAAPTSLKLWVRYVDDVFAVLKEGEVDGFLAQLNSKNKAIQFEMDKEVEGKLPFLDILVTRNGNSLSISVYRNSTHTDHLLDYVSNHLTCHKRGVKKMLWSRAERVFDGSPIKRRKE